jgi:hypothetical protein
MDGWMGTWVEGRKERRKEGRKERRKEGRKGDDGSGDG